MTAPSKLAFEDFALDIARRELRHGPALVPLEPQVFDLLVYVIQNRERVVSKCDLVEAVWGGRRDVRDTLFGEAYTRTKQTRLPIEDEVQRAVGDFAFGEVWSRPGLPLKTRSLITIAMLAALYRTDQLRTHLKVALRVGVTPDEIMETLMQVGVYAGLPTYGNAHTLARELFKEQGLLDG